MGDVLVLGSLNMDMILEVDRFPLKGETVHAGDIKYVPGGKGANSAVAASRLGANVKLAGCVGDDQFGADIIDCLQQDNINIDYVSKINCSTGLAVVLLDITDGQNSILVTAGANALLKVPAVDDWYQSASILLLQLETPYVTVLEAARGARAQGIKVMLDPAPASLDLPKELFSYIDILLPNATELSTLTGLPVDSLDSVEFAAQKLISETSIKDIIVTLGERGSLWVSQNGLKCVVEPHVVDVVDTTAAGDTFAGALAVCLAKGESLDHALVFANAASALACTSLGAQSSIPNLIDVKNFIDIGDK